MDLAETVKKAKRSEGLSSLVGIGGIKGEGNLISKTAPTNGHDEEPKAVLP